MATRTNAIAGHADPPTDGTPIGLTPAVDPLEGLGLKLANLRARRRMSRTELAQRIGCTWETVLCAEIGERLSICTFWASADSALHARGQLLAAAERAGIKRLSPRQQPEPTHEQVKLTRYRQIQRTNRVFADRLSVTASRRQRRHHTATTADHQRPRIEHELTALTSTIRTLLRRDNTRRRLHRPLANPTDPQPRTRLAPQRTRRHGTGPSTDVDSGDPRPTTRLRNGETAMSIAIPLALAPDSTRLICPPWCQALHVNPEVEDHIRMVDAVHRNPHLESVAVELEQAADTTDPLIVLSIFTQKKRPKAMSAGLTIDEARQAYSALGEALRLACEHF